MSLKLDASALRGHVSAEVLAKAEDLSWQKSGKAREEHLLTYVNALHEVVETKSIPLAPRSTAFMFLLDLAESIPKAMKDVYSFTDRMVSHSLALVVEGVLTQDDEKWLKEQNDEAGIGTLGAESLDRLARNMPQAALKTAMPAFIAFTESENWADQYAGVMGIGFSAEGFKEFWHLDEVMGLLIPLMEDSTLHMRVQWALCNTIGQLCSEYPAPTVQRYADQCLPWLVQRMTVGVTCVRCHAASTLVNWTYDQEDADPYTLSHIPSLIQALAGMCQGGPTLMPSALTAIAAVAAVAKQRFLQAGYYQMFMPGLRLILQNYMRDPNPNTSEWAELLHGTLDCISVLGIAVGPEAFSADAREILQFLAYLAGQFKNLKPKLQVVVLEALMRVAVALRHDFAPHLPHLIPLFRQCLVEEFIDAGPDPQLECIEVQDSDDHVFRICKHQLDLRSCILRVIASLCLELPTLMVPYALYFLQDLGITFAFPVSSDIEELAWICLNQLAKLSKYSDIREELATEIFLSAKALIETAIDDADFNLPDKVSSFASLLEPLSTAWGSRQRSLSANVAQGITSGGASGGINNNVSDSNGVSGDGGGISGNIQLLEVQDRPVLTARTFKNEIIILLGCLLAIVFQEEDEDEGDEEEDSDEDHELGISCSLIFEFLCKYARASMVPLPWTNQLLRDATPRPGLEKGATRRVALLLLCDYVQYCMGAVAGGSDALRDHVNSTAHRFAAICCLCMESTSVAERHTAAYGIGLCGLRPTPLNDWSRCLNFLIRAIEREDAYESESNVCATDNTISAVGILLTCQPNAIVPDHAMFHRFLGWLPLRTDQEEQRTVMRRLIRLVDTEFSTYFAEQAAKDHLNRIIDQVLATPFFGEPPVADPGPEIREKLAKLKLRLAGGCLVPPSPRSIATPPPCVNVCTCVDRDCLRLGEVDPIDLSSFHTALRAADDDENEEYEDDGDEGEAEAEYEEQEGE